MLRYIILSLLLLFMMESCQDGKTPEQPTESPAAKTPQRVVSLNGTLTELLYEVGYGDQIVGVDITSTYPKATESKTNLGHARQLNAEAILALEPSLILVDEQTSSSAAIVSLKNSGIQVATITVAQTLDGSLQAVKELEKILAEDFSTTYQQLEKKIADNKARLEKLLQEKTEHPKVLFIYARGAQTMMVAGKNTFADKMIREAGGVPAVEGIEGFQPLTPEALLESQPDCILMFNSGLESLADAETQRSAKEQLFATPGLERTPAAAATCVITMDGAYLSGFGPRASAAALELAQELHP